MPETTTAADVALELIAVDPAQLGVRDQARADATPDEDLIASIRQFGIMQPPSVTWDEDLDQYVILIGHRRVGAAIVLGLNPITVILRPADAGDDEAVKLEQQIVENERRKALTAAEVTQGFKKLELFGKTPAEIAAELGEKPEKVRAGLRINKSKAATTLLAEEPSINFEQAAIIAEFDDHPKLQRKLIETATTNPANFQRDVENQRTQREVDARVAKLKGDLEAEGVALAGVAAYDETWFRGGDGKGRALERLGIRVEEHLECPGHAAVIHKAQSYYLKDQPSEWILYVCTDWEGNGHATAPHVVERTPEELEAEAERERRRQEWAEAQQLREANTRARREWIHGYLTTGRLRPTAAHFDLMAEALAAQIRWSDWIPSGVTVQLLEGNDDQSKYGRDSEDALAALVDDGAVPNLRIIVATAIATFEDGITRSQAVKYFAFLESIGYTLTDTDREHLEAAKSALAAEAAEDEAVHETDLADESGDDVDDED